MCRRSGRFGSPVRARSRHGSRTSGRPRSGVRRSGRRGRSLPSLVQTLGAQWPATQRSSARQSRSLAQPLVSATHTQSRQTSPLAQSASDAHRQVMPASMAIGAASIPASPASPSPVTCERPQPVAMSRAPSATRRHMHFRVREHPRASKDRRPTRLREASEPMPSCSASQRVSRVALGALEEAVDVTDDAGESRPPAGSGIEPSRAVFRGRACGGIVASHVSTRTRAHPARLSPRRLRSARRRRPGLYRKRRAHRGCAGDPHLPQPRGVAAHRRGPDSRSAPASCGSTASRSSRSSAGAPRTPRSRTT